MLTDFGACPLVEFAGREGKTTFLDETAFTGRENLLLTDFGVCLRVELLLNGSVTRVQWARVDLPLLLPLTQGVAFRSFLVMALKLKLEFTIAERVAHSILRLPLQRARCLMHFHYLDTTALTDIGVLGILRRCFV